jgi:hypothetical protein
VKSENAGKHRKNMKTTNIIPLLLLSSAAAVWGDITLCQFACTAPCNDDWGTSYYICPTPSYSTDVMRDDVSAGPSCSRCCLLSYSRQGNTGCQNVGDPITCGYTEVITFCDGSRIPVPHNPQFQPQTPGGGNACTL